MWVRDLVGVMLAAFVLYGFSAARDIQWQDRGAYVLRLVMHQPVNELGLALSHPLHHWICRGVYGLGLMPPPLSVSLVSSFFGALTVACVFGCVVTLTACRRAALLSAASLLVANTFWQMSAVPESYTISSALLAMECWCLILIGKGPRSGKGGAIGEGGPRPWFLLAAFVNGLGVSNHLQSGLTTPVLAVVGLVLIRRKRLGLEGLDLGGLVAAGAAWLIGAGLYGYYCVREWIASGDFPATLHNALFGVRFAPEVLNTSPSAGLLAVCMGFVLVGFPNLTLPAFGYALTRGVRRDIPPLTRRAMIGGLAIHALFVFRYSVPDQHTFLLPTFTYIAIFSGVGFARLRALGSPTLRRFAVPAAALFVLLTPMGYALIPAMGRRWHFLGNVAHTKPYRNDYDYLFLPWAVVERSAAKMSAEAVALATEGPAANGLADGGLADGGGMIVFEDRMARYAIEYAILMSGKDITAMGPDTQGYPGKNYGERTAPVVLVPLKRDAPTLPAAPGTWSRSGDLYVWTPPEAHP